MSLSNGRRVNGLRQARTANRTVLGQDHGYCWETATFGRHGLLTMPRRACLSIPGIPWQTSFSAATIAPCVLLRTGLPVLFAFPKKELAEQLDCAAHAYVLMTNHVHLLLTPHRFESPVPRGMGFPANRQQMDGPNIGPSVPLLPLKTGMQRIITIAIAGAH